MMTAAGSKRGWNAIGPGYVGKHIKSEYRMCNGRSLLACLMSDTENFTSHSLRVPAMKAHSWMHNTLTWPGWWQCIAEKYSIVAIAELIEKMW